ncbi:MAG TPA: hypothetical protein VF596_19685 [Pyrinomonadaceae bacterium]|jgi:hypothetical protein
MKQFIWLAVFCIAFLIFFRSPVTAQCNGERWSVKIGTDPDAASVNLNSAIPTTIAELSAIPAPTSLPDNARIQPTETTLWVLNATMVKYIRSEDSDYHIVFSDNAGRTLISEIPDPACVGTGSSFAAGIARARAQFDAMFTATNTFQTANVPVQITGVGFFDYLEGQEGIAPNGIELHPIIDIVFGPTFSLSSSASSLSVNQSGTTMATISSTLSGNFNSAISLTAAGLPAGTSASFSPSIIAAPGSGTSILTITAGSPVPTGTYNVVITGAGGGQNRSVTVNLMINSGGGTTRQLLGNPGFENGSANPSPWTASKGVINNSNTQPPRTGSWKAWLNGYGAAHTDTLYQQVSIPANTANAALSFWLHIDTAEATTAKAYDTLKLQIRNSTGTVLTTLATYSNLNAATGYRQESFDLTAYKGQTVQIYLIGTEDSSLKTSFVVDDFALNVMPSGGTAQQLIGNQGFENGSANPSPWFASAAVIDNSNYQAPRTGLWKAWLNGYGSVRTDTLFQQVNIPAAATNAALSFWLRISTDETTAAVSYDTLKLQVRNSSGATLETLATYSNLEAAANYTQKTFDLTAYKGQTIQIYLIGAEDSTLKTSFLLDDFALNATIP